MSVHPRVAEFNRRVAEKQRSGLSRMDAVCAVAKEDPQLHQDFLVATNQPRLEDDIRSANPA